MEHFAKIRRFATGFVKDETGAITVDWVVLSAAVIGLVTAIFVTLGNDQVDYAEDIGSFMSTQGVKTSY